MRVSIKGQVTIPINIRTRLGLLPETEVMSVEQGEGVLLKKQQDKGRRGSKLLQALSGKGTVKMSTDMVMKLTRS